jgi:hypothetical protein
MTVLLCTVIGDVDSCVRWMGGEQFRAMAESDVLDR